MFHRSRALRFARQYAIVRGCALNTARERGRARPFEAQGKRAVPPREFGALPLQVESPVARSKPLCCHITLRKAEKHDDA